jgi:hypothetical protein
VTATLPAIEFFAPLVNPDPNGLYAAVDWTDVPADQPSRWLGAGVRVHVMNFATSFGVWDVDWCGDPGDSIKSGDRPDNLDPFAPITTWSYDQCDLTPEGQQLSRDRAAQTLRLREQNAVEHEFGTRMLIDAGSPTSVTDIVAAISTLEASLATAGVTGYIHAGAGWAAPAAAALLIVRGGTSLRTPLGHQWVFGGGYSDALGDKLVATSQPFGWRDQVVQRETIFAELNEFIAISERSMAVGYEHLVDAVEVTP